MQESKLETSHRLQRAGLWSEATKFREEARQNLRSQGRTKDQARAESWALMVERYPPLVEESTPEDREDPPVVQATEPEALWPFSEEDKDWVWEWFGCSREIAAWAQDHGTTLTDAALQELLRLFGFAHAWAFLRGSMGDRPEGCGDRSRSDLAALIDCTFQELAKAIDVDMLHRLWPAELAEPPQSGQ